MPRRVGDVDPIRCCHGLPGLHAALRELRRLRVLGFLGLLSVNLAELPQDHCHSLCLSFFVHGCDHAAQ